MVNPFKRPFKHAGSARDKLLSIIVFGLFIFLFLFLFRPFGMNQLKTSFALVVSLGFGLVTTFMLLIFKFLFEPVIARNNWTLGRNLIWDLFIASGIGVANYFYVCLVFNQVFIFKYLLYAIWTALLVGSIPVTITYIVTFNRIYRDALKDAAIPQDKIFREDTVVLKAGNPKNELKLNRGDIIYLCSNDNYVTVVAMKEGAPCKTTIRGTLKAAESELGRNSRFLRCHKCYIINLDYVSFVRGHSQNMIIRLTSPAAEIPVSRSKAGLVLKKTRGI
jgi:LytTr DNA-binding domain